jgi:hypothetical protein
MTRVLNVASGTGAILGEAHRAGLLLRSAICVFQTRNIGSWRESGECLIVKEPTYAAQLSS